MFVKSNFSFYNNLWRYARRDRNSSSVAPEIADHRARLIKAGAVGALMSGSGSSVYGIFKSREAAEAALLLFEDLPFAAVCETKDGPFEEV